jgi:hypothetical protein
MFQMCLLFPHQGNECIALMMDAASTSETSVNFYQTTQCNIPQDSHLQTYCHENLKYHLFYLFFSRVVKAPSHNHKKQD